MNIIGPKDTALTHLQFDLPPNKDFYTLDQLAMLNIIAANAWKRPICFTSTYSSPTDLGLAPYLRQQGLIFQLVPIKSEDPRRGFIALDKSYDLLMNNFRSGGADTRGVYFDEENRRHLLSIRQTYAVTASSMADAGRKQEAINMLVKEEKLISTDNLPYGMVSREGHNQISMMLLEAAYKAGYTDMVNRVKTGLVKDLNDQINYLTI